MRTTDTTTQPSEPLIALGAVARPHGVRGALRVFLYNPESTTLYEQSTVVLRPEGDRTATRSVTVLLCRPEKHNTALMIAEGIGTLEDAEQVRGWEVCVPRSSLPVLDHTGEFYHFELQGMQVLDPTGRCVGEVIRVESYPTVDALVVRSAHADGSNHPRTWEIPFLDAYVQNVDRPSRMIHLTSDAPLQSEPS